MSKEAFYFFLFICLLQCTSCSSALLRIPSNLQPSMLTGAQPAKTPKLWNIPLAAASPTSVSWHRPQEADGPCCTCCILVCWVEFKFWLPWWMCRDPVCFALHAALHQNTVVKWYLSVYLFISFHIDNFWTVVKHFTLLLFYLNTSLRFFLYCLYLSLHCCESNGLRSTGRNFVVQCTITKSSKTQSHAT